MAKKIDMVSHTAESCVVLTVDYEGTTTRAYRPANGAEIVHAVYDACKEYGTQGRVTIDRGVWRTVAEFEGADIWTDHVMRCRGHYRRRNVDRVYRRYRHR